MLIESGTIQKSLSDSKSRKTIEELSKKFKNYMNKAINAALKILPNTMKDGILLLNNETLNNLKETHPESKNADNNLLP